MVRPVAVTVTFLDGEVEAIVAATGWQPHSVRGAISGSLKKKFGLMVTSEKPGDGPRRYRIVAPES